MNPYLLMGMAAAFLSLCFLSALVFWVIGRRKGSGGSPQASQPAFRLAEQWLSESQRKIEEIAQKSEVPLSTAQNELLELRLEAGRLPQGAKSLGWVRETLRNPIAPQSLKNGLLEMTRIYLDEKDYRVDSPSLLHLKSPLGELPCLEIAKAGRILVPLVSNPAAGAFLYFPKEDHYQMFLKNPEWVESFRSQRWLALDFKGLTALLTALRLFKEAERLVQAFEAGVQSTLPLVGQADRMNAALSGFSADCLKLRTVMEGSPPHDLEKTQSHSVL